MADRFRTTFDWDDARVLIAVATARSLSGAARKLRVNHATISRRLARLEAATEQSLVERRGVHMALTAAGEAAVLHAQRMQSAALDFQHSIAVSDEMVGPVRVSAIGTIADRFLAPALAQFAQAHPAIELELHAEDRNVQLSSGEADVAIRMDQPRSGDALTRKLGDLHYAVYGSPAYLAQTPEANRRFIGFSTDEAVRGPIGNKISELSRGDPVSLRCPSMTAQLEAVAGGVGLALLPRFLGSGDPRLQMLEDPRYHWSQPVWLVVRSDVSKVARVRAVADAIGVELERGLGAIAQ